MTTGYARSADSMTQCQRLLSRRGPHREAFDLATFSKAVAENIYCFLLWVCRLISTETGFAFQPT